MKKSIGKIALLTLMACSGALIAQEQTEDGFISDGVLTIPGARDSDGDPIEISGDGFTIREDMSGVNREEIEPRKVFSVLSSTFVEIDKNNEGSSNALINDLLGTTNEDHSALVNSIKKLREFETNEEQREIREFCEFNQGRSMEADQIVSSLSEVDRSVAEASQNYIDTEIISSMENDQYEALIESFGRETSFSRTQLNVGLDPNFFRNYPELATDFIDRLCESNRNE